MQPAMRNYLELVLGITDASRKKAKKAVKDAVGRGNATVEQIKALTSDLVAANSANRDALANLVRFEVDRALGVVGLATADEVKELTARVRDLERQLREATAGGGSMAGAGDGEPSPDKATRARTTAKASKAAGKAADTGAAEEAGAGKATGAGKAASEAGAGKAATGGAAKATAATRSTKKTATKTVAKKTSAKKAQA
jgi:polyhydroxyalkanoate synthesis regulator phasin